MSTLGKALVAILPIALLTIPLEARAQGLPSLYFHSVSGPTNIPLAGNHYWSVTTNATACITWYYRPTGGQWTAIFVDDEVNASTLVLSVTDQTPSFELQVHAIKQAFPGYCTAALGEVWSDPIAVSVEETLYPPLQVTRDVGTEFIFEEGTYSWSLQASGGTGTYQINWYVAYDSNPQQRIWFYDGPTAYLDVDACDGGFHLYYTVTSGDQIVGPYAGGDYVFNFIYGCDEP